MDSNPRSPSLDSRGGEGAGGRLGWPRKTPSLFKGRRIVRLGQISRYGDDLAICLARNLGRCCFQRLPATRADRNTPSVVACRQNRASRVHELPEGLLKIPGVSRDRDQRHKHVPVSRMLPMRLFQDRHGLSGRAGRIDAGAGRRGVKRCPSSRRLAAHHQHIGCQIERFISIAVARHLSGGSQTPAAACSGSAFQAGSSKTLFGQAGRNARAASIRQAGRNARAASILRIQCGTAVSGCLGKADTRG